MRLPFIDSDLLYRQVLLYILYNTMQYLFFSFIAGGNRRRREKNTDLWQVTDKLIYFISYNR